MIASILNALQSAILLLIVTRVCGAFYAGIISIASTLGYQMMSIGNYGMRTFQVTDVNNKYSFSDYLQSRIVTFVMMILVAIIYLVIKAYPEEKSAILMVFIIFKGIDAIEDVFHGEFQRKGRLDLAAIAVTIRYIGTIIFFAIFISVTHNLLLTCIITVLFTSILFIVLTEKILKCIPDKLGSLLIISAPKNMKNVFSLLMECLPLFLGTFLYLYISNAPKYAVDNCLSQQYQAYFGIIFMPIYAINLLSTMIYKPLLTPLATYWVKKEKGSFRRVIVRQIALIFILTILGVIGTKICGTKILGIIYGVEIDQYNSAMVLLMIGGGFAALVGFLGNLLTIIRKQKALLVAYIIVGVCGLGISDIFVFRGGVLGAAFLYLFLLMLLCGLLVGIIWVQQRIDNK